MGAGNGEMMKILFESFQKFPLFFNSCNLIIFEKSPLLIKIQKKKLNKKKITWISKIGKISKVPSIFVANEFFDSLPIKQFEKNNNVWFEKFVKVKSKKKIFSFRKKN